MSFLSINFDLQFTEQNKVGFCHEERARRQSITLKDSSFSICSVSFAFHFKSDILTTRSPLCPSTSLIHILHASPLHCIPDTILGLLRPPIQGSHVRPPTMSNESLGSNSIRHGAHSTAPKTRSPLPSQHHRDRSHPPSHLLDELSAAIDEMSAL